MQFDKCSQKVKSHFRSKNHAWNISEDHALVVLYSWIVYRHVCVVVREILTPNFQFDTREFRHKHGIKNCNTVKHNCIKIVKIRIEKSKKKYEMWNFPIKIPKFRAYLVRTEWNQGTGSFWEEPRTGSLLKNRFEPEPVRTE